MAVTPKLLFECFLAGLALILSSRGLILLSITIVLSVLGVVFHTRAFPRLALILILFIFVLNLHVFYIFQADTTAENLNTLYNQAFSITNKALLILAKAVYNLGILLIPLIIYFISQSLIGRPVQRD